MAAIDALIGKGVTMETEPQSTYRLLSTTHHWKSVCAISTLPCCGREGRETRQAKYVALPLQISMEPPRGLDETAHWLIFDLA